jgi:hypothetical protein
MLDPRGGPHLTSSAMNARIVNSFLAVLALAACSSEQKIERPDLADVMPFVPLPPNSSLVGSAGSAEALQFTFQSQNSQEEVVAYYRTMFTTAPWTFISDAKAPEGAVILYVENDGIPLWVRIARTPGAPGTTVQLSGALITRDTALVDSLSLPTEGQ